MPPCPGASPAASIGNLLCVPASGVQRESDRQEVPTLLLKTQMTPWRFPACDLGSTASLVCHHLLLRWSHVALQMKSSFKISLEDFWEERKNPTQLRPLPKASLVAWVVCLCFHPSHTGSWAWGKAGERQKHWASFTNRSEHLSSSRSYIIAKQN